MSGGTNKKISKNNKQVEKQYKYDKEFHKFQESTNKANYDKAVADTVLQQSQADKRRELQERIKTQQFNYQSRIQKQQYNVDKEAYKQSLKDYDKQTELNSRSGAIAKEAAERTKAEALIKRNFDLEGQDLNYNEAKDTIGHDRTAARDAFTYAKESQATDKKSIDSKIQFTSDQAKLDKKEIKKQKKYLGEASTARIAKLDFQKDKLNKDISYLDKSNKIDVKSINLVYDKKQSANFNSRIASLIKLEQEEGEARAAGREGLSADRARTNALADYGRSQAQLVEGLVFASDEKKYALRKGNLTKKYQTRLKLKDKKILEEDKGLEILTKDRQISKLNISKSKINNALEETVAQLGFDKDRVKSKFDKAKREKTLAIDRLKDKQFYLDERNSLAKRQIKTTYDSAKAQFTADKNKIKLDEYAANLSAHGKVLHKPKRPVDIPVPYKTLKTRLPVPQQPFKAPKPIKGALGKTSIWNDVGDAANVALSIASFF